MDAVEHIRLTSRVHSHISTKYRSARWRNTATRNCRSQVQWHSVEPALALRLEGNHDIIGNQLKLSKKKKKKKKIY